ncbi:hypothetical protein Dimus_008477 [Dionaea muscipula]
MESDFGIEVRSELALRPMEEMELSMEELGQLEASISPSSGSSTLSPSTAVVLYQAAMVAGGPLEVSSFDSSCLGVEDVGHDTEVVVAVSDAVGAVAVVKYGDSDRGVVVFTLRMTVVLFTFRMSVVPCLLMAVMVMFTVLFW